MSEKISRNHRITYLCGPTTRVVKAGDLPPLKAIRAKCIDCGGGSANEAKLCVCTDCPLWPYRLGKNPFRQVRVLTEEQRAEMASRLAAGRTKTR